MTKQQIEKTLRSMPGIEYEKYKECSIYQNPGRCNSFSINDTIISFKLIILLNKEMILFNSVGFENHIMEFNYDDIDKIMFTFIGAN